MILKLPQFFVGLQVIALESLPEVGVKKGDKYPVKGVKDYCCGTVVLDIGIKSRTSKSKCSICGTIVDKSGDPNAWYLNSKYFAPAETEFIPVTFNKILELEKLEVSSS